MTLNSPVNPHFTRILTLKITFDHFKNVDNNLREFLHLNKFLLSQSRTFLYFRSNFSIF